MSSSAGLPALGADDQDARAALLRGAAGAIPLVGSIFGELITMTIPNQRQDRFEKFIAVLAERVGDLQAAVAHLKEDPQARDLFEEGASQAARALSPERHRCIASIVANGLSGEERAKIASKRLLKLLAEIDDEQVILLCSYSHRYMVDGDWKARHRDIVGPMGNLSGADRISCQMAETQLERLGLVSERWVDHYSGRKRRSGFELSPLGKLLLQEAGLI